MPDPSLTNALLLAAGCRANSPEPVALSRMLLAEWVANLDGPGMADLWEVRISLEVEREEVGAERMRQARGN